MGAIASAKRILSDAAGLSRVCGPGVAARWLWNVGMNFRTCARSGELLAADLAMGEGPFAAKIGHARASIVGEYAISGIRDLWVREAYLGEGYLAIGGNDIVVDLGTNMGNFTLLALAMGPGVRVAGVEANKRECAKWRRSVEANGWTERAVLVNAFLGQDTPFQERMREWKDCEGVETIGESEFLRRTGIDRVDFLKCDIEGGEFPLLRPGSRLLGMARQLAIEVHKDTGSVPEFRAMLESQGFMVRTSREHPNADILLAKRG